MSCPSCGSDNIHTITKKIESRSRISVSKGLIGGLLLGPLGAAGGALIGNKKEESETKNHCRDCGKKWKPGFFG